MSELDLNREYFLWGLAYCTPFLFYVSLFVILWFFTSWYLSAKRTGWKIDYWYFTLGYLYVIRYFIMYPFAAHPLNVLFIGNHHKNAVKYVDSVFLLHLIGFMLVVFGGFIYNKYYPIYRRPLKIMQFDRTEKFYAAVIKEKLTGQVLMILAIFFYVVIIVILTSGGGDLTNPRKFFLANRSFNPVFLLTVRIISLGAIFSAYKVVQAPTKGNVFNITLFILLSTISGTRSAILSILVTLFLTWCYKNYRKVKFSYIFFAAFGAIGLLLLIGAIRTGSLVEGLPEMGLSLFYGNNFSDLRDSAWFFSQWDQSLVLGKNYLADIMVFIPSEFSSFRQDWSYGFYTIKTALGGHQALNHPGLRIGFFGEIYANFGFIGVMILGTFIGFVLKWIDHSIKFDINNKNDVVVASSRTLLLAMVLSLSNSASAFLEFYISIFFFLFFGFLIQASRKLNLVR